MTSILAHQPHHPSQPLRVSHSTTLCAPVRMYMHPSHHVPSPTASQCTLMALNLTSELLSPTRGSREGRAPASRADFLPSVVTTTLSGQHSHRVEGGGAANKTSNPNTCTYVCMHARIVLPLPAEVLCPPHQRPCRLSPHSRVPVRQQLHQLRDTLGSTRLLLALQGEAVCIGEEDAVSSFSHMKTTAWTRCVLFKHG